MQVRHWTTIDDSADAAASLGLTNHADLAAAVLALSASAESADGLAPVSEQPLLHLKAGTTSATRGVRHLVAVDGPDLLGYAYLEVLPDAPASAELAVAPQARRRGVGTALLQALESLALEGVTPENRALESLAEATPADGGLRIWAHGYLPAAQGFAQAVGLDPVRELWRMSRPLTAADAVPPRLPEGFAARAFTADDIDAWVAVNAVTFATHPEQGRITRADVEQRMTLPWFDAPGFLLVEDSSRRLAAYHWTKVEDGRGEVYVVGVHPAYQGLGLGKATTLLGLAHLAGRGLTDVDLYVDADNAAAVATYRTLGFTRTALDVMLAPRRTGRMGG